MSESKTSFDPGELRPVTLPHKGVWPRIAADAFIAPGAAIVGDVEIGSLSTIWFHVTIRGDVEPIRVGEGSSIQDGTVLHTDPGFPCIIGNNVTVGHSAIVHGAVVEDDVTIGMGAIILSGAKIGRGAIVAAGAVVLEGREVAPGTLVMGLPAKERGPIDETRSSELNAVPARYVARGGQYRATIESLRASADREGEGGASGAD